MPNQNINYKYKLQLMRPSPKTVVEQAYTRAIMYTDRHNEKGYQLGYK